MYLGSLLPTTPVRFSTKLLQAVLTKLVIHDLYHELPSELFSLLTYFYFTYSLKVTQQHFKHNFATYNLQNASLSEKRKIFGIEFFRRLPKIGLL